MKKIGHRKLNEDAIAIHGVFNADGSEGCVFNYEKIHTRHDYQWIYPVHEVLKYLGQEPENVTYLKGGTT